jgi:enoyl-CoA hydratase/carnithine racemase
MQDEKIIGDKDGPVGHIIFNNPAKLNAVALDMWERVHGLLREYAEDTAVRAVVISGAGGKAFVSGADISKFESERANMEAQKKYEAISGKSYDLLYNFPKPTIAKITGYCIGGGMNLAGCCDLRFCNEAARFGVPAAKLGLGYGFERIRRLAEALAVKTLEVIYTGRQFSARRP